MLTKYTSEVLLSFSYVSDWLMHSDIELSMIVVITGVLFIYKARVLTKTCKIKIETRKEVCFFLLKTLSGLGGSVLLKK